MAHFVWYLIVTLLFISQQQLCSCGPRSELTLSSIGAISGVMGIIDFVCDKVDRFTSVEGEEPERFSEYKLKGQLNEMTEEIIKSIHNENQRQTLQNRLNDATDAADQIDEWYKEMVEYNKTFNKDNPNQIILNEANRRLINGPYGPRFYLRKIHKLFFYREDENIVQIVDAIKKGYEGTCSTSLSLQSVQQIYYKYFLWNVIAQAKTYLTISMAVEIIRHVRPGVHENTLQYAKKRILKKNKESIEILKYYMKRASREVWRCDPDKQVEDVTYIELKRVFQKYIIKEADMGTTENNCKKSCTQYGNPTKTIVCFPEDFNGFPRSYRPRSIGADAELCGKQRRCSGELWDCKSFNVAHRKFASNDYLSICNSDKNGNRRYDYVEKTNGRDGEVLDHWGRKDNCKRVTTHATPTMFDFEECEICLCTCADNSNANADEYVSLHTAFSAYHLNRVVTGARLVKKYNTLRIEIEEGTLGKAATIVDNDASWVVQEYHKPNKEDFDDRSVYRLKWKDGRSIQLNELHVPKGYAIIGIGFEYNSYKPNDGLYLEVYSQPFDFETGKLQDSDINVKSPDSPTKDKIILNDRDIPTLSGRKNVAINGTDKLIEITTTGLKEDIGQTVIPFFDSQEVTTTKRMPMAGVGLYYKSYDNFGGFLGLKLFSYDIEPHLKY